MSCELPLRQPLFEILFFCFFVFYQVRVPGYLLYSVPYSVGTYSSIDNSYLDATRVGRYCNTGPGNRDYLIITHVYSSTRVDTYYGISHTRTRVHMISRIVLVNFPDSWTRAIPGTQSIAIGSMLHINIYGRQYVCTYTCTYYFNRRYVVVYYIIAILLSMYSSTYSSTGKSRYSICSYCNMCWYGSIYCNATSCQSVVDLCMASQPTRQPHGNHCIQCSNTVLKYRYTCSTRIIAIFAIWPYRY